MSDDFKKDYKYPSNNRPTTITAGQVTTNTVDADHLILGGDLAEHITSDATIRDPKFLITSLALNDTTRDLLNRIAQIDPNNNFFQDNTVLTLPVIDAKFSMNEWTWYLWDILEGTSATFTGTGNYSDRLNYLKLINYPFTRTGNYFISIDVNVLDSGTLTAYDETDTEIAHVQVPGTWNFVYHPNTPHTASIKLVASDVLKHETIVIDSVNAYFITPRLERYLKYIIPIVLSGGSGFATVDEVQRAIEGLKLNLQDEISLLPTFSSIAILSSHVQDRTTNPHGITPEMIHASPDDHTHTLEELHAAAADHTHTPISIGAAEINHTHSLVSLNAAAADHTHTPESIGAADRIHTHEQYLKIVDLEAASASSQINTILQPSVCQYSGKMLSISAGYFPALRIPRPLLMGDTIVHRFHQPTDPIYGTAYSDTPRILDSGAWSAFYRPFHNDTTEYFAIYGTVPSVEKPVMIGYRLHTPRRIRSYTITRMHTGNTTQLSSWQLKDEHGTVLDSRVISWGADEYTKTFAVSLIDGEYPLMTDLRWYITNVDNVEYMGVIWGIHITITCMPLTTKSDGDIILTSIVSESKFTTNLADGKQRSVNIVKDDIRVNSVDVDKYDELYIYADTVDDTVTYGYTTCPPEYNYDRQGIALFEDYDATIDRGRYGTLSTITTLASNSSLNYLYTLPTAYDYNVNTNEDTLTIDGPFIPNPLKRVATAGGMTNLFIEHADIPKCHLCGYKLYLSPSDIEDHSAPTHLEILYNRTVNGYMGAVPDTDEYGNTIISGNVIDGNLVYTAIAVDTDLLHNCVDKVLDWTYYDDSNQAIFAKPISNITALTYNFTTNDPNATHLAILGIQPLFTNDFYSISDSIMYDYQNNVRGNRTYIGILSRQALADSTVVYYPYVTPIGTEVTIPLDISLAANNVELTLPNPFFTTQIAVYSTDGNFYNYIGDFDKQQLMTLNITPSLRIKNITPDKISMIVQDGLRGIVIRRLW